MSKQAQGFVVGLETREVVLVASQNGREHRMIHTLRQPTMKEMKEYGRMAVEVKGKGRKTRYVPNVLESRVWLYDRIIQSVEGYWDARTDSPLTVESENWKEAIPPLHKSAAIESFGGIEDDEVEEDNEEEAPGKN